MTCTARVPRRASTPVVRSPPPPIRLLAGSAIERARRQEATFHHLLEPSLCQRAGNDSDSASGEGAWADFESYAGRSGPF